MIGFVLNSRWDDYRRATLVSWLHLSFIVVVIIVVDVSILHRRQFVKIWLFNSSLMTLQLKFMKHMQVLHLLKEIWMNIINLNNKPDPRIDYIFYSIKCLAKLCASLTDNAYCLPGFYDKMKVFRDKHTHNKHHNKEGIVHRSYHHYCYAVLDYT